MIYPVLEFYEIVLYTLYTNQYKSIITIFFMKRRRIVEESIGKDDISGT